MMVLFMNMLSMFTAACVAALQTAHTFVLMNIDLAAKVPNGSFNTDSIKNERFLKRCSANAERGNEQLLAVKISTHALMLTQKLGTLMSH